MKKGKDYHYSELKLNNGVIAETSSKLFHTITSSHSALDGLTKSWSSRKNDSRQCDGKMDQEGLQSGQRPETKENDD